MGINKQKYYDYVKNFFKQNECELLTIFENFTDKTRNNLVFKCKCGNIQENINFKWYNRSIYKSCKKCVIQNNTRRNTEINNVIKYFKKYNCELLTFKKDYINNITKNLSYKCKCGTIVENESYLLYYLSTYKCCEKCRENEIKRQYVPFEEVQKIFIQKNIELLTTKDNYIGTSKTKFSYKCKCGIIVNNISYHSFVLSKYKQCKQCVKKLIKKTCLKKYGYEIPMHNDDILDNAIKKQYNLKDFTFKSGNTIKVQGYEDLALQILNKKYNEQDIVTNRKLIPRFNYIFKNKQKKYLPDIYIPSKNKIIEVKSNRTFEIMKIQNIIKSLSVRKAGYDFEFWIFYKVSKNDIPNYKYFGSKHPCFLKLIKI